MVFSPMPSIGHFVRRVLYVRQIALDKTKTHHRGTAVHRNMISGACFVRPGGSTVAVGVAGSLAAVRVVSARILGRNPGENLGGGRDDRCAANAVRACRGAGGAPLVAEIGEKLTFDLDRPVNTRSRGFRRSQTEHISLLSLTRWDAALPIRTLLVILPCRARANCLRGELPAMDEPRGARGVFGLTSSVLSRTCSLSRCAGAPLLPRHHRGL